MADSPLKFSVDIAAIAAECKKVISEVEKDIMNAVEKLAKETKRHTLDLAKDGLTKNSDGDPKQSSRIGIYDENLSWETLSPGLHVVYLNEPALWIENGIDKFDMKPGLLKGRKYRVIPIKYSTIPSRLTTTARELREEINENLRKINRKRVKKDLKPITMTGIAYEADGKTPKLGKLHTFNFGGRMFPKGNTPALDRVNIYQRMEKGNIRRDVVTFRTVTAEQTDKWIHPGLEAKNFMDKAFQWAEKEWETVILPDLKQKWSSK